MKTTTTLFGIGITLLLLTSCESEYNRQLRLGKDVIKQSMELSGMHADRLEFSASEATTEKTVKEQLQFHAHMSGNQELFNQEMVAYKVAMERETRQLALKND